MMIKANHDYALRMCAHLARKGCAVPSSEIAEAEGIPHDYLIQIAQRLRNAGIVEARTGRHGGYRLAKDPGEVRVLDVMLALGFYERERLGKEADYVKRQLLDALDGITLLEAIW